MAVIYLIRHAQTVDNLSKKFSGYTDCKLSRLGYSQIEKLSIAIKNINVDKIYTSPLERARLTSKAFDKEALDCSGLREMNFGDFEEMTFQEIQYLNPIETSKLFSEGYEYKFPRGESLVAFHERVKCCFYNIINESVDNEIAIVAHSGTIRCILSELIGKSYEYHWNFQVDNCSITKVTYTEGFGVINYLNDTSHLR